MLNLNPNGLKNQVAERTYYTHKEEKQEKESGCLITTCSIDDLNIPHDEEPFLSKEERVRMYLNLRKEINEEILQNPVKLLLRNHESEELKSKISLLRVLDKGFFNQKRPLE